jgi:hypothetical protein
MAAHQLTNVHLPELRSLALLGVVEAQLKPFLSEASLVHFEKLEAFSITFLQPSEYVYGVRLFLYKMDNEPLLELMQFAFGQFSFFALCVSVLTIGKGALECLTSLNLALSFFD